MSLIKRPIVVNCVFAITNKPPISVKKTSLVNKMSLIKRLSSVKKPSLVNKLLQ